MTIIIVMQSVTNKRGNEMRPLTTKQRKNLIKQINDGANYKPQFSEIPATKEISEITQKRFSELSPEEQTEFKSITADAYITDSVNGGRILIVKKNQLTDKVFSEFINNQF